MPSSIVPKVKDSIRANDDARQYVGLDPIVAARRKDFYENPKSRADGESYRNKCGQEWMKKLGVDPQSMLSQFAGSKAHKVTGAPAQKQKAEAKKEPTPEEAAAAAAEAKKKQLKKVIKEGGKRGVEIEGAADMGGLQFFCTSVDEPDGDLELTRECMNAMNAKSDPTEEERKGGSGAIGKMIFSAGATQLAVNAYVPEALKDSIDASVWLKTVLGEHGGVVAAGSSATNAFGTVQANQDKGLFPMKIKEPCITAAITYLKGKGLFPDKDDDSDDEFIFGDDDFPS